ncbi:DUF6252 family protein [Mucilaginibacter sp. AK015]|uniref:DUF6252 family protein n=1 Tax=Mucilaginibacter sp. AK015 TaxID=2723072 RepID=UPI001610D7B4|nr:DUF6252 family protein [Mucilaginibacter sp. AK015]MBB5397049.1 hypothetical protein [Mucilaginibacter sp. AK015]
MKKFILTFTSIAAVSLLLTACIKNDDNCCAPPYQPYFAAERAGLQVYAEPGSKKIGTDSIAIAGITRTAGIIMHVKYTGKGVYTLTGNQGKYYQLIGNDTVSRYSVGLANGSSIEVTDVDSVNHAIEGKFTLNLKRTFPATSSTYPDSVKYTKGQFLIYLPRN